MDSVGPDGWWIMESEERTEAKITPKGVTLNNWQMMVLTITGWEHSKRKGEGKSSCWGLLS